MRSAKDLLKYPSFGFFWIGKSVSGLGDAIAQVAMVLYVYHTAGSPQAIGSLLFAQVIPRLLGPMMGVLADRMDQKRLLIFCDLIQAALFFTLSAIRPPLSMLLLVVAVSTLISTLSAPAGRSAMAGLLPQEALLKANVLLSLSGNISTMLGPALGGMIVAWSGTSHAFAVDAATFLCSAASLSKLPALEVYAEEKKAFVQDFVDGLRYIAHHRIIRMLSLTLFVYVGFAALDNMALVFLAHQSLKAGDQGYGWLSSAYGIGMLVGTLTLLRLPSTARPLLTLVTGFGLFGLGTLLTGLAPTLLMAMTFSAIAAFGNSFENVMTDTLVQRTASREMLGRVFGTMYSSLNLASSVTYTAGGWLAGHMSPRYVLVLSGASVIAFVVFAAWRMSRMDSAGLAPSIQETA